MRTDGAGAGCQIFVAAANELHQQLQLGLSNFFMQLQLQKLRLPNFSFYCSCDLSNFYAAVAAVKFYAAGNVVAVTSKIFQKFQIFPARSQLANCTKIP